ncbi:unnamed protein product [Porites lobata]|uniref:Phospholipase n=1 Tax=Porites lobata TaxID=104759 RepID=A0ABN8R6D3_9CNID|nr:unnamed protein product [Porites lobata]
MADISNNTVKLSITQPDKDSVVTDEQVSVRMCSSTSNNLAVMNKRIDTDSGSVCINLEEFTDDDVFDGSISYHSQDKKKGAFLPGLKVTAEIIDVERAPRTHPFNPNLYTIKLTHGSFSWEIRRRYKHFLKLDAELFFHKVNVRRHSLRRDHTPELRHLPSRHLPRRPDMFATTTNMEKRKKALQKYLQVILDNPNYRNHKETLNFLEVSHLSFQYELGEKRTEGVLRKRAGGQKFPAGCCSCCAGLSWGIWDKRWLVVKDSFIAYVSPKDKEVRGVVLMDKEFSFKHGRKQTGVSHGLLVHNQSRELLLKCWTERKASEWMKAIVHVMATAGADWIKEHPHDSFAPVRDNSCAQWFVDGESYFDSVADALESAEEEIFLTGWWISPEVYLRRPVTAGHDWRLDNILERKAKDGVKIYILIYKEVEFALTINSAYTKSKLMSLHPNIKVLRHPDHIAGQRVVYWAHHEKLVVVDQKVAFLGGLDLCFGRWDNCSHRLTDFGSALLPPPVNKTEEQIRKIGALIVEGTVEGMKLPFRPDVVDAARLQMEPGTTGGSKIWLGKDYSNPVNRDFFEVNKPFEDSVDRGAVPRMPWHDVGMRTFGASARDVARHFILRWNATKVEKVKIYPDIPYVLPKSYSKLAADRPTISENVKTVECQILRSLCEWSGGVPKESSIHEAYIKAIEESQHYIYIENQFFITSLFVDNVKNEIGENLLRRIERAHREAKNFKVIVVMPLLPAFEGEIGTASGRSIGAITHWNYRSICRASHSLLERLNERVGDPSKYISFYGLRTHSEIHGKPVTEMVYVHSKMMIVDDNTVIIGSANINDRSMLGKRDSEIAAIIKDKEFVPSMMDGEEYQAGQFAFSLRTRLFREHLGLLDSPSDEDIRDVVSDSFYMDLWMKTAKKNTEIYDEVFHCIPTDKVRSLSDLNTYKNLRRLAVEDPGEARARLRDVRGYLVEQPLYFLEKENLRPPIGSSEFFVSDEVFT